MLKFKMQSKKFCLMEQGSRGMIKWNQFVSNLFGTWISRELTELYLSHAPIPHNTPSIFSEESVYCLFLQVPSDGLGLVLQHPGAARDQLPLLILLS